MKPFTTRIRKLRDSFPSFSIDALLITKEENIFYLTGFRGSDSFCVITTAGKYIITDSRYKDELADTQTGCRIILRTKTQTLADILYTLMQKKKIMHLGFEPAYLAYQQYELLKKKLTVRRIKPCYKIVEQLRMIKDAGEIHLIKNAIGIAERALVKVQKKFTQKFTEKQLADYLEYTMKQEGAESIAFPTIVASGAQSAFPHALSGRRRIRHNAILLIDCGAKKGGYASDLTRTFFLGTITARFQTLYEIILEAQELAIRTIKPGRTVGEIDRKVRSFFKQHKVNKYFTHALGHAIGLEVHESPSLFMSGREVLKENMVVTVEPGLYITKWGGIRIEDMIRVSRSGCERLSTLPT